MSDAGGWMGGGWMGGGNAGGGCALCICVRVCVCAYVRVRSRVCIRVRGSILQAHFTPFRVVYIATHAQLMRNTRSARTYISAHTYTGNRANGETGTQAIGQMGKWVANG